MRRAIAASAFVLAATPAFATGEITCAGGGASVDLLVGHMDVLAISRAVITIGDKTWSSTPESYPGTPIGVGQGFEDDRMLAVDITDENVSEIIGRLRVVKAEEGEASVAGGVFTFKGHGAFVVDCSEPQ